MKQQNRVLFPLVLIALATASSLLYFLSARASPALSARAPMSALQSYLVTIKPAATDAQVDAFKKLVAAQGGKILHSFDLIKGFSLELPEIHTNAVASDAIVATFEKDSEVHIQK